MKLYKDISPALFQLFNESKITNTFSGEVDINRYIKKYTNCRIQFPVLTIGARYIIETLFEPRQPSLNPSYVLKSDERGNMYFEMYNNGFLERKEKYRGADGKIEITLDENGNSLESLFMWIHDSAANPELYGEEPGKSVRYDYPKIIKFEELFTGIVTSIEEDWLNGIPDVLNEMENKKQEEIDEQNEYNRKVLTEFGTKLEQECEIVIEYNEVSKRVKGHFETEMFHKLRFVIDFGYETTDEYYFDFQQVAEVLKIKPVK